MCTVVTLRALCKGERKCEPLPIVVHRSSAANESQSVHDTVDYCCSSCCSLSARGVRFCEIRFTAIAVWDYNAFPSNHHPAPVA